MERKFTPAELRWGGSWGLIGPVADFPDLPRDLWEELSKEAKQVITEAAIKQRIEYSNFVIARMKANVDMLQSVLNTMKKR